MPQLTFRGVEKELVRIASEKLPHELAELCQCSLDSFTFDVVETISYFKGVQTPTYPFIQVGWFDRGQEVKDRFASTIYQCFMELGIEEIETVFINFDKESYYANEKHYG